MRRHSDFDNSIITVNGELQSHVSASNRGYLFGDGVFETMLFYKSGLPLLPLHLQRLQHACTRLSISVNIDDVEKKLSAVQSAILKRRWEFAKVRLTVTRGEGGRASYASPNASFAFSICAEHIENATFGGSAIDLKAAKHALPSFPALAGIKHLNRLPYIMGANGIELDANQEVVFCDTRDNVIETMHHNIFFVEGSAEKQTIITPKLESCGVSGILRRLLKETLSEELGCDFQEHNLPLDTISRYAQCFIGNAIRGFSPVAHLGEQHFQQSDLVDCLNHSLKQRLESLCNE